MAKYQQPTVEHECEICGSAVTCGKWGGGTCPECGRRYEYDELYSLVLSDEDKAVLRAHDKEQSNAKQDQ